jgi:hypothetical protein
MLRDKKISWSDEDHLNPKDRMTVDKLLDDELNDSLDYVSINKMTLNQIQ